MWLNRKYFKSTDTLLREHGKKTVYPTLEEARKWASNNEIMIAVVQKKIDQANRAGKWELTLEGFDTPDEVLNLVVLLQSEGITARISNNGPNALYCNWETEEYDDEEEY